VRRRLAAVVPLALLVLVALAWLALGRSDKQRAGGATRSEVRTAEVQRRTLADQVTVDGTIGYAGKSTVVNRLSGTITDLARVGEVIRRGQALFGVDGDPVILMYGELPAYRRLAEGVSSGEDIRQLEENLAALGFDPGTVDSEFTSATAAAVSAWQDGLGLPQTGAVELGRVVFLPSPRRVTKVTATLGSDGGSGAGGSEPAASAGGDTSRETTLVAFRPSNEATEADGDASLQEPSEVSGSGKQPQGKQPQQESGNGDNVSGNGNSDGGNGGSPSGDAKKPSSQTPAGASHPTAAQDDSSSGGSSNQPAASSSSASTPVLETSSTKRIVIAQLDADQQDLARKGQRVGVTLPDGRQAPGEITRLQAVESSGDQGADGGEPGVEATIKLVGRGRIPALDGAAVSVSLTEDVRRDVLTVPLTALISIGANRFAVIAREGSARRRIVVTPGLAAEGYVEVEGEGLHEGMEVEASE
jgi:hypothetical protein